MTTKEEIPLPRSLPYLLSLAVYAGSIAAFLDSVLSLVLLLCFPFFTLGVAAIYWINRPRKKDKQLLTQIP